MAATTANLMDPVNLRASLDRMDDSIVFSLMERAQYRQNAVTYLPNNQQLNEMQLHELKCAGSDGCVADWFLYQTESLHSQGHRYVHPTEQSFFGPLWDPARGNSSIHAKAPDILASIPTEALINKKVMSGYRGGIVATLCEKGDDGDHGSSAVQDVRCLQAMATRIYSSLLSAESKFFVEREKATALIHANDRDGLLKLLGDTDMDKQSVRRAVSRARAFAQSDGDETIYKASPELVGEVFQEFLLPLAEHVQLEYLLARLDREPSAKRQRLYDLELAWGSYRSTHAPASALDRAFLAFALIA